MVLFKFIILFLR